VCTRHNSTGCTDTRSSPPKLSEYQGLETPEPHTCQPCYYYHFHQDCPGSLNCRSSFFAAAMACFTSVVRGSCSNSLNCCCSSDCKHNTRRSHQVELGNTSSAQKEGCTRYHSCVAPLPPPLAATGVAATTCIPCMHKERRPFIAAMHKQDDR
jgi:hypothetical protein